MPDPLEPWQSRLLDEHAHLVGQIERLSDFLTQPNQPEADLLILQRASMQLYCEILRQRIAKFTGA